MSSNCTEIGPGCPADGSNLGYAPSTAASGIFLALFGISLACQVVQGWKYKTWSFMFAMCLGSAAEVVGYLGRILMHNNPYKLSTFLVQIVSLTTAPAFYSAGLYLCLSRIVIVYGREISRVKPIWYTRFFVTADIISLSLQGGGGGVASSSDTRSMMELGNHLMLAGLIFQIVSLVLFAIVCIDLALRIHRYASLKDPEYAVLRASARFRGFLVASVIAFLTIFTRCVYRVIELGGGWNNHLMREEVPFIILESCMITIAVFSLVAFHPGFGFQNTFHTLQHRVASSDNSKASFSMVSVESTKSNAAV